MTTTTFYIIFVPILAIILLAVNLVLAPHNPYQEKDSVFECGFHSFLGQNRTQFSVSFFIFGLLFLLFDLEILLVFPYGVSSYNNDYYGLSIMMLFFVLLTLGFVFELGKNALTIESKQTFTQKVKSLPTLTEYTIYLDNYIMREVQSNLYPLNKSIDGVIRSDLLSNIFFSLRGIITKIYFSVTIRKIFIIFLVGLLSRITVNYVFEINVVKDYTEWVSLVYYAWFAGFSAIISKLPAIDSSVLKIETIEKLIKGELNARLTIPMEGPSFNNPSLDQMLMNGPGNGNPPQGGGQAQSGGQAQGGGQVQGVAQPASIGPAQNGVWTQHDGFQAFPGNGDYYVVRIDDPRNTTALPYISNYLGSCQPYATNLANGLVYQRGGHTSIPLHDQLIDPRSAAFIEQFMREHYPNRHPRNYLNSNALIRDLRNLR